FIYRYLIVLLTISLSLMGSTYLIEFLVKLEINKISCKLKKNTESIVKGEIFPTSSIIFSELPQKT
ncbi:hypothetical protein, partial [Microcystis sp. M005S1]|uniref:hypothetical protein n=1 Tax=Microcystis sp. M005S1 TaxID=2771124 RepID=UPI00258690C3